MSQLTSSPVVDEVITDPYSDMQAHQRLMMQLEKAVDECQQTIEAARQALEELSLHNLDATAHSDIRITLDALGQTSNDAVDERISQHNESPTAHPALVAKLEAAMTNLTAVRALMDQIIAEHNSDTSAHSDLREFLTEMRVQMSGSNLGTISETLEEITEYVDNELAQAIVALQNVDARHDKEIHENLKKISAAVTRVDNLTNDLDSLAGVLPHMYQVDALKVANEVNFQTDVLGITAHNDEGPDLFKLEHTFPPYVTSNKEITFQLKNALPFVNGSSVFFAIEQISTALTFSPNNEIGQSADIVCHTGNNLKSGDILTFKVIAKDIENDKITEYIIGTMVSSPMNMSVLSCDGLPDNVEPGAQYTFKIRNLIDDQSGRWTYSFNPKSSSLNFSPTGNLKVGDEVTVSVPTTARRGSELEFAIIVHDKYYRDLEKNFIVHVNTVAGAEDLETTVPSTVIPGNTYEIKFSGILSADNTPATYSIEKDSPELSFSKDDAILANENVKMVVSPDAQRGDSLRFVIVATDNNDNKISVEQYVKVNELPTSDNVECEGLPEKMQGGVLLNITFTGGDDPESADDQSVTYAIDNTNSGLPFSKMTSIKPGETVLVTIPKVSVDTVKAFSVYVVDEMGERSAEPKVFEIQVEPIYIAHTPYITSPQDGNTVDVDFAIQWSEFSMYVDMSSSVAEMVANTLMLYRNA